MMLGAFTWGAGGQAVPSDDAMKRRARISEILLASALSNQPAQHWSDGVTKGLNILAAGYFDKQNRDEQAAGKAALSGDVAKLLGGSDASTAAPQAGLIPQAATPKASPLLSGGQQSPAAQPNVAGIQPVMRDSMAEFVKAFPEMEGRITSGYRDPARNAAVGGAKGSRHIQGDAIDFSLAGLPEERQQQIAQWWRERGAGGFGYYPNKQAMHVDFGAQRAWGPNYSRTSLGDTPQWFQGFVNNRAAPQQAPVQVAGPTPLRERTLGAVVRNGLQSEAEANAQPAQTFAPVDAPMPPQRPAQPLASVPAMQAQAQMPPQATPAPAGGISQERLRAAYNILNSPFAGQADKAVAQTIIQKALNAETKDPRDSVLKDQQIEATRLGIEEKRRGLNRVEMETITDPATGMIYQRPKGTTDAPQPVPGLGPKPVETTTDQKNLEAANKDRQKQGLPPLRMDEYQMAKSRAAATNINNDLSGGSSKQVFDELKERATMARSAATGLTAINQARKAVEEGGFFGAGADARLTFAKIGAALGYEDGRITNTETFRSAIAPQVAAMLKSVAGTANLSNADREFAEKAAGGSIALDQKTITRLLDIMERGNKAIMADHQSLLDEVYPATDDRKYARERALFGIRQQQPATPPSAPAGATPAQPQQGNTPRRTPQTDPLGLFQ